MTGLDTGREYTLDEVDLVRSVTRDSLYQFVREFWHTITQETPRWNWHIEYLCGLLQQATILVERGEPRPWDLLCNISPGTTKSTVFSIMWPAWVWTWFPRCQFIGASYSEDLARQLSVKTRDVVTSDLYRACFPEVVLREDQNTKGHFANTKGGFRYCVGVNGMVTGMHGHCLPWGTRLVTDRGMLPIGEIVDNNLAVHIMTFDHTTNTTRWQPIENYQRRSGRDLCRVRFTDGTWLDLTDNHELFVPGKGYVPAGQVVEGDTVYATWEEGVAGQVLCHLPEGVPVRPGQVETDQDRQPVLLGGVLPGVAEVLETEVRGVREGHPSCRSDSPVLFDHLSVQGVTRRRTPAVRSSDCSGVQGMWVGDNDHRDHGGTAGKPVLFQTVCRQTPFQEDARGDQLQLRSRDEQLSVPAGVSQEEDLGSQAREAQVLSVLQNQRGEREGVGGPPRRLRQDQQQPEEPSGHVQVLPFTDAPAVPPSPNGIRKRTVSAVERAVRFSETVYNLQVAEDRNYFAEGVLVHNCICVDDPINPNQALSAAERKKVNHWCTATLPSRKVDKAAAFTAMVMQRVHEDDPSGVMAKRDKVFHVNLPARDTGKVNPPALKAFYQDGLMDPVRLSDEVLDDIRKEQGPVVLAGQYMQDPVPEGGALFDVSKIRTVLPTQVPRMERVARAWDKACLRGSSLVTTTNGQVPIKDVRAGDVVRTRGGWRKVLAAEVTKWTDRLLRVTLGDGQVLEGTPDHMAWVEGEGWTELVRVQGSRYSHSIPQEAESWSSFPSRFEKERQRSWCSKEYGLLGHQGVDISERWFVSGVRSEEERSSTNFSFIGRCIWPSTGAFQKGMKSTIRTRTGRTIILTTWLPSPNLNMVNTIGRSTDGMPPQRPDDSGPPPERRPWPPAQQGRNGQWCVRSVELPGTPNYIQTIRPISVPGGAFGSRMLGANGRGVEVLSVEELILPFPEPVYDIEVEDDHEFFASGVLVHNCALTASADWTVGTKLGLGTDGRWYVLDVIRKRVSTFDREELMRATAKADGRGCLVVLEEEGGSGGKHSTAASVRYLAGFRVRVQRPDRTKGSKAARADPLSVQVNAGNVRLVEGDWNKDWLDEVRVFPFGRWDDQVDSAAMAFNQLAQKKVRVGAA